MTEPSYANAEFDERSQLSLQACEGLLSKLERLEPPVENALLDLLNSLLLELENLTGDANLFSQVHPDLDARRAAEQWLRQAHQLHARLRHNTPIYEALGALDQSSVHPFAWRFAMLTRQDMRRAGVELREEERDTARRLREDLVALEQEFARNIRDSVREIQISSEDLDGLPSDYIAAHPIREDGLVHITTRYPDYYPFMSYARSERARLALLHEFYTRAVPSNLNVLSQMLEKRHQLAKLLGYASWADYVTEDKMIGSATHAASFLEHVEDSVRVNMQTELSELLAFKRQRQADAQTIGLWESLYYQQRVKAERFALDARLLRPYFEYRSVKQAILSLNSELFGLIFVPVEARQTWHPSVESFDVEMDGRLIGRISLDMHPRPGKYTHAALFHWRKGVASRQLPHVVLVCNFPDPRARSDPALLEHQEVVTFFHEFGHLVHALVRGNTPWVRLADPTERDFVEAPSQFMEEWIFDADVLRHFARHIETGELIPAELVDRLNAARKFGRALYTQWLLFRSHVSLALHDGSSNEMGTTERVFELARRYLPYELPDGTHYEASFDHLPSHSAAYYTYLWSQAIAKDLHSAFSNGLMNTEQTRRFRDQVLAPGGTRPAAELLADFLGRPWSFDAFTRWVAAPE